MQPGYRLLILKTASYWSRASIVVPTTLLLLVLSLTRNLRSMPHWASTEGANPKIAAVSTANQVQRVIVPLLTVQARALQWSEVPPHYHRLGIAATRTFVGGKAWTSRGSGPFEAMFDDNMVGG